MRVYCGRKTGLFSAGVCVWRNGRRWSRNSLLIRGEVYGPDFAWGLNSSSAQLLAYCMLADVLGSTRRAGNSFKEFAAQVVSKLPDHWVLTGEDVEAWWGENAGGGPGKGVLIV